MAPLATTLPADQRLQVVRVDVGEPAPFDGVLVNEWTWEQIVQSLTQRRQTRSEYEPMSSEPRTPNPEPSGVFAPLRLCAEVRDCVAAILEAAAPNALRFQSTLFTERSFPALANQQREVVSELRRLRVGFLFNLSSTSQLLTLAIIGDVRVGAAWAQIQTERSNTETRRHGE